MTSWELLFVAAAANKNKLISPRFSTAQISRVDKLALHWVIKSRLVSRILDSNHLYYRMLQLENKQMLLFQHCNVFSIGLGFCKASKNPGFLDFYNRKILKGYKFTWTMYFYYIFLSFLYATASNLSSIAIFDKPQKDTSQMLMNNTNITNKLSNFRTPFELYIQLWITFKA